MELTNKIMTPKEFKEKRKRFGRILAHALQRKSYQHFDETVDMVVPENIREAYFELFADSVDKKSIQHGNFMGDSFLESKMALPFYGRSRSGSNFVLTYLPKKVELEISAYSFNGDEKGVGISEIGLFSTHQNKDGNFQTDLRVGDQFAYHSGFVANHSISSVIDEIQKSEVIPHIPQNLLNNLLKWKEYHQKQKELDTGRYSALVG